MVFDHIEKLKREFTDKYVVVDNTQPELRRFDGQTGIVRTVNMNGKALVEFDAFQNIGWFDISLDFLKVIDAPLPKEEAPKKAPAKKAAKPAAKTEKPAAQPSGGGMSVAEMLAAARGEKSGDGAPAAEKQAAPKAAAPKSDSGKMSVAEMLAAARAEKGGGTAAPAAKKEPAAEEPAPAPEPEPVAEEAPAEVAPVGDLPKETPEILAYCRKVDS